MNESINSPAERIAQINLQAHLRKIDPRKTLNNQSKN